MAGLAEQFALVGDSLRGCSRSARPSPRELQDAVAQTQQAQAAPPPRRWRWKSRPACSTSRPRSTTPTSTTPSRPSACAASPTRLAARRARASRRSRSKRWMEELYRRVSDRQTMGSVVQELRASLSEAEKPIDQFFRNPERPRRAHPGAGPAGGDARRAVGARHGPRRRSALLRMRDEVDGLVSTEVDPTRVRSAGVFDRLAGNLAALGFLIDMLSVQPQMAKSLFPFDAADRHAGAGDGPQPAGGDAPLRRAPRRAAPDRAGAAARLQLGARGRAAAGGDARPRAPLARGAGRRPAGARRRRAEGAGGDRQGRRRRAACASARGELSEALVDFVATASEPVGLDAGQRAGAAGARSSPITLVGELEHDDEMREIFLEEAREVIESAQARLRRAAGRDPATSTC